MINSSYLNEWFSVVIIGDFNPLIFHPFWLVYKGLVSETEVTTDSIIVHPNLTKFNIGQWLDVIVEQNRSEFKTSHAEKVVILLDLVKGVLNALPDIKITAIGINRGKIIDVSNSDSYYKFGSKLANFDLWSDNLNETRLRTIIVEENGPTANFKGNKRSIIIKPANMEENPYAIDFNMNNHYTLPKTQQNSAYTISLVDENATVNFQSLDCIIRDLINKMNSI